MGWAAKYVGDRWAAGMGTGGRRRGGWHVCTLQVSTRGVHGGEGVVGWMIESLGFRWAAVMGTGSMLSGRVYETSTDTCRVGGINKQKLFHVVSSFAEAH